MSDFVAGVVKILLFSVVLLTVLQVTLLVSDILLTFDRINEALDSLEEVVSEYNCVPNAMKPSVDKWFSDAVRGSRVFTSARLDYTGIDESNPRDFGDVAEIKLQVVLQFNIITVFGKPFGANSSFDLVRYAPCLRYLK